MDPSLGLDLLGFVVLSLLPGLGLVFAVFPERIRPTKDRGRILVEVVALTGILSVVLTILAGELLQTVGPGFSASWSNPRLELLDLGVGGVGIVIGVARGALTPDAGGRMIPGDSSGRSGWETLRRLELLARQQRELSHRLQDSGLASEEREQLLHRQLELRSESDALRARREAEFVA